MTRDEKRASARRMRNEGATLRAIADRFDVSKTTVLRWTDDEANARHLAAARAYKERSRGACVDCGARTNACRGRGNASERCAQCAPKHSRRLTQRWILDSLAEWVELFGRPPAAYEWNLDIARSVGRLDVVERYEATGRPWPSVGTVQDNFGSWNAGLEAAGLEALPPGVRRDPEAHAAKLAETRARKQQARWEHVAALFNEGVSHSAIGAELGITANSVAQVVTTMRRAGWDLPDRRRGPKAVAA